MYAIFALICILYILINIFVGIRIQKSLAIASSTSKKIFWIIFSLIASSFLLSNLFRDFLPNIFTKIIYNVGAYYLGLLVYIIPFFIISFFITSLFKKSKLDYYSISMLLAITISIYGFWCNYSTKTTNYDVKINSQIQNTDNLKIALVSDIHLGYTLSKNSITKMVQDINALNPDIVIVAGDLIDGHLNIVLDDDDLEPLSKLQSTYGTYFALGNHDCYSDDVQQLCNNLRSNNVTVLNDECVLIDDSFYIIGRVDKGISHITEAIDNDIPTERNSLTDILCGIDKSKPTILIDHNPNSLKESAENDIDIQLSGHTHNGQLFPANYIVKYTASVPYGYDKLANTNIVVSSGYGLWGPPIRTTGHSEISLITLHN